VLTAGLASFVVEAVALGSSAAKDCPSAGCWAILVVVLGGPLVATGWAAVSIRSRAGVRSVGVVVLVALIVYAMTAAGIVVGALVAGNLLVDALAIAGIGAFLVFPTQIVVAIGASWVVDLVGARRRRAGPGEPWST
jgi:hypothetical protein